VLVLGAAGAMGVWLTRFLQSIGHRTEGVDTAWAGLPSAPGRYAALDDAPGLESFEAVFVSVPLEDTPAVLNDLAARELETTVFEITSIKSHVRDALALLRSRGCLAVSLHPMFGPGKNPYGPLTVVHAAGNDEKSEREATLDLLGHPYLDLVSIPFERHDRIMGWLLGLAHLTGMLFANALTHSGLDPAELGRVASTTFERQVDTAQSVLGEDPELYFSIQRLNPFQSEVYAALGRAMKELTGAIEGGDLEAFEEILARAARALP
jgi:prephenate dehydrogenase